MKPSAILDRLLARLDQLVASCTAPSTTDEDLRSFVAERVEVYPEQVERARNASQARSDRVRGRIRAAWGRRALSGEMAEDIKACQDSMAMLGYHVADWRTVESELLAMRAEQTDFGMSDRQPTSGHASLTSKST